jgi:hypothetical protein
MRFIIKTSFILATIVLGAVFSQAPAQNNTQNNGSQVPPPQNGTSPNQNQGSGSGQGPQGSGQGSGSGAKPSGSGGMRSGNAPTGPSNLPPQEPGITDALAAVTDSRIINLKKILQYLPPNEQDLIAGKFCLFTY